MARRAYTEVGPGTARVGNAWCERAWSAFVGNTIELTQRAGQFQWLRGDALEFQVVCDDRVFGVMELGDIEWSEERTQYAEGLVLRKQGPEGLGVLIRTYAFHDHPGMLRTFRVYNAGYTPRRIEQTAIEALALGPCEMEARTEASRAVFTSPGRGLLLEVERDAENIAFAPDLAHCTIVVDGPGTLAPGTYWDGPDTYLMPFTGEVRDAEDRLSAAFRDRVAALRAWWQRCAAREDHAAQTN